MTDTSGALRILERSWHIGSIISSKAAVVSGVRSKCLH